MENYKKIKKLSAKLHEECKKNEIPELTIVMGVGEIPIVVCHSSTGEGVIKALAAATVYIAEQFKDIDIDEKTFNRQLENEISHQKEIRDQVKRILKQWKEINHDE